MSSGSGAGSSSSSSNSNSNSNQLRTSVIELLQNFVSQKEGDGEYIATDILRVLQEESKLLYETRCIHDLFDQDPFQCYSNKRERNHIHKFQKGLKVTSCHRVEKDDNYCLQEGTVRCCCCDDDDDDDDINGHDVNNNKNSNKPSSSPAYKKQKRSSSSSLKQQQQPPSSDDSIVLQLFFRYERIPATAQQATSIWYSIDYSTNYGPKQNIVTIRVWADGNKPSKLPAVSIEDDDDDNDDWEDIDDDEDDEVEEEKEEAALRKKTNNNNKKDTKKISTTKDENDNDNINNINEKKNKTKKGPTLRTCNDNNNNNDNDSKHSGDDDNEDHNDDDTTSVSADRFACFVDPDTLLEFQQATQSLEILDQATAFFTLMTFPFYQHEWDLVGFVLDSVFGYNDNDDDNDDDDDNNNNKKKK